MDRGIELSLNFLVVVIISVVVFGFGVAFITKIASNAQELKSMTLEDIDRSIVELRCRYNEKVCLEQDRVELKPGQLKILTLQVLNIEQAQTDFLISVEKGIYVSPENIQISPGDAGYENLIEVLPLEREETIGANEAKTIGIGFELPKRDVKKGTYVFDITIEMKQGGTFVEYDAPHKFYIAAS